MKKIILIVILFFNLIPVLKEGKIELIGAFEALADEENGNEFGGDETDFSDFWSHVVGIFGPGGPGGFAFIMDDGSIWHPTLDEVNVFAQDPRFGGIPEIENPFTGDEPTLCEQLGMIDSYCGCVTDLIECETVDPIPITQTYYKDNDLDGWGNASETVTANTPPSSGWVTQGGDLNDNCYNVANEIHQCEFKVILNSIPNDIKPYDIINLSLTPVNTIGISNLIFNYEANIVTTPVDNF